MEYWRGRELSDCGCGGGRGGRCSGFGVFTPELFVETVAPVGVWSGGEGEGAVEERAGVGRPEAEENTAH